MKSICHFVGIDLGTSGVRIAVINSLGNLIYSKGVSYTKGLQFSDDWKQCCQELINSIPKKIKPLIKGCSVDGTSGTLLACDYKGNALGEALPYYVSCPSVKDDLSKIIDSNVLSGTVDSSLARALLIRRKYKSNFLLRHQADWISGWLVGNWECGEESNNLKLGWDPILKAWPKSFNALDFQKSFPKIIESGRTFGKISNKHAKIFGLQEDLLVIAGTTDSNASVISTGAKDSEGITVLGSTIVIKTFVEKPIIGIGITNNMISGKWLCGGSSNAGGSVLKKIFKNKDIEELSKEINPKITTGIKLRPLSFKGERFPIYDPNLEPILEPRPESDAIYLHAILEGLAEIEAEGWRKLIDLGAQRPEKIITIGGGSKNDKWRRIREKIIGIPITTCDNPPALGSAYIALSGINSFR